MLIGMAPGVSLRFKGLEVANHSDILGPNVRFLRQSPGAAVWFEDCVVRRRAGLPYTAALQNMLAAKRPDDPRRPQNCSMAGRLEYDSTAGPVVFDNAIAMTDYGATVAAESSLAFQGITYGGYAFYALRSFYAVENLVPQSCLDQRPGTECVTLLLDQLDGKHPAAPPPPHAAPASLGPGSAGDGGGGDGTDTQTIVIAVVVPVVCVLAIAVAAAAVWAAHRGRLRGPSPGSAASSPYAKASANGSVGDSDVAAPPQGTDGPGAVAAAAAGQGGAGVGAGAGGGQAGVCVFMGVGEEEGEEGDVWNINNRSPVLNGSSQPTVVGPLTSASGDRATPGGGGGGDGGGDAVHNNQIMPAAALCLAAGHESADRQDPAGPAGPRPAGPRKLQIPGPSPAPAEAQIQIQIQNGGAPTKRPQVAPAATLATKAGPPAAVPTNAAAPTPAHAAERAAGVGAEAGAVRTQVPDVVAELGVLAQELRATVNDSAIRLDAYLGAGSFGTVYRGTWQGLPVAVKTVVFSASQERRRRALQEAALCQSISHPNIIATYTTELQPLGGLPAPASDEADDSGALGPGGEGRSQPLVQDWRLYIVMEYADAGPLAQLYGDKSIWPAPDMVNMVAIVSLARCIARGLAHLHSKRIVHADLNPNNVMLKRDPAEPSGYAVKIGDFGLSVMLPDHHTHLSNLRVGTMFYVCPLTVMKAQIGPFSDIFSLGVVLWELYHGRRAGLTTPEGPRYCSVFPAFLPSCPPAYSKLAMRCLRRTPQKRPSAEEVESRLTDMLLAMQHQLATARTVGEVAVEVVDLASVGQRSATAGNPAAGEQSKPCAAVAISVLEL
ncbi:hypothetical protein HYH03_012570 [Edaphochlamys debaryana]|uniref:Protein kinase domain-containing protein n=1 Tax=Edaphochlamys debaryana TaxID=47281 RepID=A0A836BTV5_9CHLO|nr:hypothetical protein HYH03_012570 [Edaphochlamys debaryana]|eukprot:KAG2488951.1 hypothetical protein HYH03_012570 [Edaphochlamys debaryana]